MKRHYTPQCLAHVEKILEAFPAQRQQLAVLDDFIAASIRSPAISDMPEGGGSDSEPERILAAKERSPQYRDLAQSVEAGSYLRRYAVLAKDGDGRYCGCLRERNSVPLEMEGPDPEPPRAVSLPACGLVIFWGRQYAGLL